MKKLKNTFIIWVILLVVGIIASQIFKSLSVWDTDTETYVSLIQGQAKMNDDFLELDIAQIAQPGDVIRTIGKESLALIEWGDGSMTRLAGNTRVSITRNDVSPDQTLIDISFELFSGKTWSQVVSFISEDSSFTQQFEWVEAWVRGTVFDVDLTEWIVYVSDHQIDLINQDGDLYTLDEKSPLKYNDFSLISLEQFLSEIRDTSWSSLNQELDINQLGNLKTQIEDQLTISSPFSFLRRIFDKNYSFLYDLERGASFEELRKLLDTLWDKNKMKLRTEILSRYQKLNIVSAEDPDQYADKILHKRLLVLLSTETDQERLLETSLYDFKDILKSQNIPGFDETLKLLNENANILEKLDTRNILGNINLIPDDLEQILSDEFQWISDFFEWGLPDTSGISVENGKELLDSATDSFRDAKSGAEEVIENGLDTLFEWFTTN